MDGVRSWCCVSDKRLIPKNELSRAWRLGRWVTIFADAHSITQLIVDRSSRNSSLKLMERSSGVLVIGPKRA